MNSILDAIKQYPEAFIQTARSRANTSPSHMNRTNHIKLVNAIREQNWDEVSEIITNPYYYRAFEGVVHCLGLYGGLEHDQLYPILMLHENGMII